MTDLFRFKEFQVYQNGASLKVGTDAMVLGAVLDETKAINVLDIGTGTGVLALMFAQRNPQALIDAIEIDEINSELAELNIKSSKFHNQIRLIKGDFFDFTSETKYDLIFSNPPFFIDSLDSLDKRKSNTRHLSNDQFHTFIDKVYELLDVNGVFYVIFPIEHSTIWYNAIQIHFFIQEEIILYGKPEKAKRIILKCAKFNSCFISRSIVIRNFEGKYTDDYIKLTKDFHGVEIR